jgi:hypothetical protein
MTVLERPVGATKRRGTRFRDTPPPVGTRGVATSYLIALAALLLAALLDAEALHQTATTQPFGWRYDVATAVTDPLVDVSRALRLTEPRHWLEDLFDRPSTRPPTAAPALPTTAPPRATPTSDPSTTAGPGPSSTTTSTAPSTTIPALALRTPTAADPLRVLIAGDSMTESAGPALVEALDGTGVVRSTRELRYSSGLTRPDYFDWPARLRQLVAEQRAEAIVLWLGANDAQGIQTPAGPASFGSDAWVTEYRGRVAALMDELTRDGRVVYWLGEPVMRSSGFDERMQLITRVYREEASRHPGVRFVDTRQLFSDPDGSYDAYLPGSDGRPVLVRRDDGIHLTEAGADRLVPAVMAALRRDVRLP